MTTYDSTRAEHAVRELLEAFGIEPDEHTEDTPRRVAEAWAEQLSGYHEDPTLHLSKTFPAPENPGLVVVRNIRVQSTCAHHLLPISGTATIAYRPWPGARIVGLSKLNRLADGYARRLQTQENITAQIVEGLAQTLNPAWAACAIRADHGCMSVRGVRDECCDTLTFRESGTPSTSDLAAFWDQKG